MQTLTEAEVAASAMDVEPLAIGEMRFVAVGGSVDQQHDRALGDRLTQAFGVVGDIFVFALAVGASKRSTSSMAPGISLGSATSSLR